MRKVDPPRAKLLTTPSWCLPCLVVPSLMSLRGSPPAHQACSGSFGTSASFLDVTTHYTEPLFTKLGLWQLYYKFITC